MLSSKNTELLAQTITSSKEANHTMVKKDFSETIKDIAEQLKLPDSLAKRMLAAVSNLVQLKRAFEKLVIQNKQLQHFIQDSAKAMISDAKEKRAAAFENWKNSANKLAVEFAEKRQVNNTSMMNLSPKTDALEKQGVALEGMITDLINEYTDAIEKEHNDYHLGHEKLCGKLVVEKSTLRQNFEERVKAENIDRETPEGQKRYDELEQQYKQEDQALDEKYHGADGKIAKLTENRNANLENLHISFSGKIAVAQEKLEAIQKGLQDINALMQGFSKPENLRTQNVDSSPSSPAPFAKPGEIPTLIRK